MWRKSQGLQQMRGDFRMTHGSMFNHFGGDKDPRMSMEKAFGAAVDASHSVDISLHDIKREDAIKFMDALCMMIGRTYEETVYDGYSSFEMVSHTEDKINFTCYTPTINDED